MKKRIEERKKAVEYERISNNATINHVIGRKQYVWRKRLFPRKILDIIIIIIECIYKIK